MARNTRTGGRDATESVIPGRIALSVGHPLLPEPSGFGWRKLTDLARIESGHTPSRSRDDYWGGEIPWIGIRDATGNHGKVISETANFITRSGLDNSSARLLPAGTVCLSRTASVGYVVEMGQPMATSQDFVNWACGPDLSSRYLRYVLMLEHESVLRFAHGTVHMTMYYPEAKALHILAPDRPTQDRIAEVLGALDDKIAANDRIATAALSLGDSVFSKHLSELDGGQRTLGELAETGSLTFGDGYRTKRSEHGRPGLRILRAGDVNNFSISPCGSDFVSDSHRQQIGSKMSHPGDIILTTKGTVGRTAVIPSDVEQVVYSPQICYFRVINHAALDWGYLAAWFRSRELRAQITPLMFNSDMAPYINLRNVRSLEVRLPSRKTQSAVGDLQRSLLTRFDAVQAENGHLAKTRDELLPLLMSGKIRVRDAERTVEEVV